jgi:GntR family transcriptional regulator
VWQSDDAKRATSVDGVEVTVADAPDHVATALELRDGEKVVVRRRRRRYLVDEVAVQFATSYYPEPLVRDTRIANKDTGDGDARLAELGHKPAHFREELRARMPREPEGRLLDLTQGTPVIVVVRTAYTATGRAVEVNEMTLDANAYILEYAFSAEEPS